jgi:hypothetical protein
MNVPEGTQESIYQTSGLEKPADVPILRAYRKITTPGSVMSDDVYRALNTRANAASEASVATAPSRYELFQRMEDLFGKNFNRPDIEYVGPSTRRQAFLENGKNVTRDVPANKFGMSSDGKPLTGSLLDMMQNPDYYRLTPEQRNFFQNVLDPMGCTVPTLACSSPTQPGMSLVLSRPSCQMSTLTRTFQTTSHPGRPQPVRAVFTIQRRSVLLLTRVLSPRLTFKN